MKRFISLLLVIILSSFNFTPLFASETIEPNTKINLEFAQHFNANKCSVGDKINFRLKDAISENGNVILPKGTYFVASVTDKDKSKFGFRRAIAHIKFEKFILPDGREYSIILNPDEKTLKSSEILNLTKAAGSTAVCAGVCMVGAIVIAVEAVSVVGILFLPYAGIAVGGAIAVTGKGLNYKAHEGTPLTITLKEPLTLNFRDYNQNVQDDNSNSYYGD